MIHGLDAMTATTAAWSEPSISVRYRSSAVVRPFFGARNRLCTVSGESRANALLSSRLSSARIGRTSSWVPSLSRYVDSSMHPIVRATTRSLGERGHGCQLSFAASGAWVVAWAVCSDGRQGWEWVSCRDPALRRPVLWSPCDREAGRDAPRKGARARATATAHTPSPKSEEPGALCAESGPGAGPP